MNLDPLKKWQPPKDWLRIQTLDTHTEGEPLRIILSGLPELKGNTVLEYRSYMKNNLDHLRTALMWEPRGHADMYGCVLTSPVTKDADFGVFFLHNEGYSTMCGHAIIALTKVAVETGLVQTVDPITKIKIDTPAGLVTSYAELDNDIVRRVYFYNVPSFVLLMNKTVEVPDIGIVKFDIAFGGAFYAFVDADELGIEMTSQNFRSLIEKGMAIKKAVMANFEITHPFEEDLNFLYGTIFYGRPLGRYAHSRNVCIFADGEVDRSPTGTGVSARMALHYAKNEIKLNEPMVIESIIGTKFTGKAVEETSFGPHKAVIPEVGGTAHITGRHEFFIDPTDPLNKGFVLR